MKRIKIVYIISDIDKALGFEWLGTRMNIDKNDVSFILINARKSYLHDYLHNQHIQVREHIYQGHSDLIKIWIKVLFGLFRLRPQVVHTHLFKANLIGLTTSWLLRVPKRIFTRHHALIHHQEYPSGLKWDKLSSFLASDIVAVTSNIHDILTNLDRVPVDKITTINHGFELHEFSNVSNDRIQQIRTKYELDESNSPIIGVIARYTEWKGIQYIIPAFKSLLQENSNATLVLANAGGDYAEHIISLLADIPTARYREIEFEHDLAALYSVFDIYVHVPVDKQVEAFGQTYVEALASRTPSVFSISGVANDFIADGLNAIVVHHKNSDDIYQGIKKWLDMDDHAKQTILNNGVQDVQQRFTLDQMINKLQELYEK